MLGPSRISQAADPGAPQRVTSRRPPTRVPRRATSVFVWTAAACLILAASAVARLGAPAGQMLTGTVVDAETGRPAGGVTVRLARWPSGSVAGETATGLDGSFTVVPPASGSYALTAHKTGYVDVLASADSPLTVKWPLPQAGRTKLYLARQSAIAGRVLDHLGRPVPGVEVVAVVRRPAPDGVLLERKAQGVRAGDQGEYRLWGLPPGIYTVTAFSRDDPPPPSAAHPVMYAGGERGAPVFFTLHAGEERGATDLVFPEPGTHSLEGVVSGVPAAWDTGAVAVTLVEDGALPDSGRTVFADREGRFRFDGVQPGRCWLVAEGPVAGRAVGRRVLGAGARRGTRSVHVPAASIDRIEVPLSAAARMDGSIVWDDASGARPECYAGAPVSLTPLPPLGADEPCITGISEGGRFECRALLPGSYRLSVKGLNGCSMQRVIDHGAPAPGWVITAGQEDNPRNVELHLSTATSVVRGTVRSNAGEPADGAVVVLTRWGERAMLPGQLSVTLARTGGEFMFDQVAAGRFGIIALPTASSTAFADPQHWLDEGDAVGWLAVQAGGAVTADLQLR